MPAGYELHPKVVTRLKFQATSPLDAQIKSLMNLETRDALARHAQASGRTPRIAFRSVHSRALNLGPTVDGRGRDSHVDEEYVKQIAQSHDHSFQLNKNVSRTEENDYLELKVKLHLLGDEKKLLVGAPLFAPHHDAGFELYTRIQRKSLVGGAALDRAFELLENSMAIGGVDTMASWNMQVRGVEVEHEWPKLQAVDAEL